MAVMQEEIFGPVLPVKTYQKVEEAVDYINAHDRPLASTGSGPTRPRRIACWSAPPAAVSPSMT
jgi:coniferyl-aldehyde dehydrogenase